MSASFRPKTQEALTQGLQDAARSSPAFDRDLAATIGKCIAMRRTLCGLSKQQLGSEGWASLRWTWKLTSTARSAWAVSSCLKPPSS